MAGSFHEQASPSGLTLNGTGNLLGTRHRMLLLAVDNADSAGIAGADPQRAIERKFAGADLVCILI